VQHVIPRPIARPSRARLSSLRSLASLGALLAAASAAAQPQVDGAWSPIIDWPLIAVHAALTPDGRVLTYGTDGAGKQTGYFIYDVWDPQAGVGGGHMTLDNLTLTDIFCSSQVILPQSGDIFIAGGDNWTGTGTTNTGNNNSNIFNPIVNTLARSANMNRARWYSSSTVLLSGDVYVQGGSGGADFPEVRQQDGTFRLLTAAATGAYAANFPRNFLAPDGRVFGYDTNGKMYFATTAGTGAIAAAGQIPSANVGWTSSAAMYRPGKILQIGGNSNGAAVIDINGPVPTVTLMPSMSTRRQWVSATVLPDGKVLATGGSEVDNALTNVNNRAEIWDPATGTWRLGSAGVPARLYHSSALLLPDATVLVGGGGAPGPQVNTNVEIYSPPYLFDESGNPAPRPAIVDAPSAAEVGDTLAIQTASADVARVTIVKTGSVTHSVNMDQRFVELPFAASGNLVYADLPDRATDTPPGFYHLFVMNGAGVPSVAKMLRINVDATPSTAVDYTPTIGGAGGAAFTLACSTDETLVGVHGRFATYVNQIGAQCVRVDQFGRWIGDPVAKPLTGTTTTGTAFTKLCARNSAVSGFRGRALQYVDQIELECRALTPSGGLTGNGQFLGATGGAGGNAQALQRCGTDNPVYALYGRSGGWLDSFGVQCRAAPITPVSTNSSPVVVNPGNQTDVVGTAVDLLMLGTDGDGDALEWSATGMPAGLAIAADTGRITGVPTVAGVHDVIVRATDGSETASAAFRWTIAANAPLAVEQVPPQPARPVATGITYNAVATGGVNVRYKWQFGDGTPETDYSSSPSITHAFAVPGIHAATLTVSDDAGATIVRSFVQAIHLPLTAAPGRSSANIAYETRSGASSRVWAVNQDNDSISVFDAVSNARLKEITVGAAPRAVAIAPDGRIWVTNKGAATISVISPSTLTVAQTIALPYSSQPFGVVFAAAANQAFVALEGSGRLLKLNAATGAQIASLDVGANPRHVAIDGSGARVYVATFVTPRQPGEATAFVAGDIGGAKAGGEVRVIDANAMTSLGTVVLQHGDKADAENQGAGVPNYLGAVAISPDGRAATVPSKQDNIARGTLRSGANLSFQNTVRAISSRIDLVAGAEDYSRRIDHDNASLASAAVYDRFGVYLFVALETSREVAVIDAHDAHELFRFDVGRAPQGLVISPDGTRLYVSNFMDRNVEVFNLGTLQSTGQASVPRVASMLSVGTERLSATVLAGKRLFYDARDTRLARDRYMSCASCHNDGGQDGRVWDLTGMGEGLRNTVNLRGTAAAQGRLHWTQNFDEVQDFEGQIRTLAGGTGLMTDAAFNTGTRSQPLGDRKAGLSADLDALAAYVASLSQSAVSPYRNSNGTLTAAAAAGKTVFRRKNCAACHSGTAFTDSAGNVLRNVGTLKPTSGARLGVPLTGLDTPTLRGAWQTAPYLHDGSAASLADAVAAHSGVQVDSTELTNLAAYLQQIDSLETTAPKNTAPTITSPGAQTRLVGQSVSLAVAASDADGDALTFSASNLPAGLTISTTGLITGKPTASGTRTVTVSVTDGLASASTSFSFKVNADTSAPTTPGRPGITIVSGKPNLTWSASSDNVAVTGYIVYRSTTSGSQGSEVGRIASTTFRDTSALSGRTYYYSLRAYDAAGNQSARSQNRSIRVP
jgi:large repetitive protein